ncbi:MAG: 1-acyl-sn-glycerol-3-phosphate acyltransferase [Alphaproteobacteria bacterium]|nr:1-acyl-sn-glycerol-3-phosphate acyltransferase [Alphaproteobacteria bacterium]
MTFVVCISMAWVLLLPRWYVVKVAQFWFHAVAWIEKYVGGLSYRILNPENMPQGACLVASKHQSSWETFKLHVLFGDPAIVLKWELQLIPFWGWFMYRAGMIAINRKGRTRALSAMIKKARQALAQGRKIVIFPQGTRIAPGEKAPYKSGVAALYGALDVPIVPVAHNAGCFTTRGGWIKKGGTITLEFLPPIPAGLKRDEMMRRLESALEEASDSLIVKEAA